MIGDPAAPGRVAGGIDVAAASCALLSLLLAWTGPYRDVVAGMGLTIGWTHAAFVAAALAAIRHAALPRPTMVASLQRWRAGVERRPALADALLAFWLTRPTVVMVGLLATATIGPPSGVVDSSGARRPAGALPARWDAQWYAGIAAHGYEWQRSFDAQQNLAFFPAYPVLIRGLGAATGALRPGIPPDRRIARLAWCGLGISLAAFLWAAWYFARLARETMEAPRARAALLLLTAYPFALFFSAAYTESLFLLAALGAWFHSRRGDTLPAAAWGLVAGLSRPNGCFLSIPLGLLALGVRDTAGARDPAAGALARRLLIAAMPVVGMLLFTAYLYQLTDIWFAWARTHAAWGRVIGGGTPLTSLGDPGPGGLLDFAVNHPYDLLNGLALLFTLGLLPVVWRASPAWAAFVLVSVLVPLLAGGLLSMGRLTSTLFPLFIALGLCLRPGAAASLATGFAIGQGLLAALFYTWRGVY
jgi:hypothetical protein